MNFLAHLYLSGSDPDVRLGNFMGDFVKGSRYLDYPPGIRHGIQLHRRIDAFTDGHSVVKQSIQRMKQPYDRYAGVVVDLFYDHFLAALWENYHHQSLSDYVTIINRMLVKNYFRLPGEVKRIVPFMVQSRRLESYQTVEGIARALTIMTRHTSMPDRVEAAIVRLQDDYIPLREEFTLFFEAAHQMSVTVLADIRAADGL